MPKAKPVKSARPPGRKQGSNNQKEGKDVKLTKDEKAVVKFLFDNVENKKANMYGNNKLYFAGAKAVTCLMESKFAQGKYGETLFNNRKMAIEFCQNLLNKNSFHRVIKIVKKQKPRVKETSKDESSKSKSSKKSSSKPGENEEKEEKATAGPGGDQDSNSGPQKRKIKKVEPEVSDKKKENKEEKENKDSNSKSSVKKDDNESSSESKPKKKIKGKVHLDLNPNQTFYDDPKCYYVWVYESQSIWKSLIGGGLIIGSIAICLFPLWPEWLRYSSWYATSSVAMLLLGILIALALVRLMVYGVVFVYTKSKCRFWLLPNLFAEVGFFESFVPYYESKWIKSGDKKKDKKDKAKNSSDEERDEEESVHGGEDENQDNKENEDLSSDENKSDANDSNLVGNEHLPNNDATPEENENNANENEEENSSTNSVNENDFEVLDAQS